LPDSTLGFTGTEIQARVVSYVGNDSDDFKAFIAESLPLAEFRFLKLHDWSFLRQQNFTLPIVNGTATYTLDGGNITELTGNQFIATHDIETIYDPTNGVVLRKMELPQIRRLDPENDDGGTGDHPFAWAPINNKDILLYKPVFKNGTLKIDAKTKIASMTTIGNTLTIPYKFQESYINYVIAIALDKENDDRFAAKKQEAMLQIREDIQDDMSSEGDVFEPRIKDAREAQLDGASLSLNSLQFALFDC
jgi:hypothetical protein